ncbi:hypothetical protein KKI24_12730 [bacterium]|nr:hypothetical protein [bacterium]
MENNPDFVVGIDYIQEKLYATVSCIMNEYRDSLCISINRRLLNGVKSQFCQLEENTFPSKTPKMFIEKFSEVSEIIRSDGDIETSIMSLPWDEANEVAQMFLDLYTHSIQFEAEKS